MGPIVSAFVAAGNDLVPVLVVPIRALDRIVDDGSALRVGTGSSTG